LKLGLIAFGGPAAHIALMRDEVVKRRHWLSDQQFLDLLGAENLIPGPSSTELAIFLGYTRAGWIGLLLAGTLFILPAMLIVLGFAWAYVQYGSALASRAPRAEHASGRRLPGSVFCERPQLIAALEELGIADTVPAELLVRVIHVARALLADAQACLLCFERVLQQPRDVGGRQAGAVVAPGLQQPSQAFASGLAVHCELHENPPLSSRGQPRCRERRRAFLS
jgi:hypothetical protein